MDYVQLFNVLKDIGIGGILGLILYYVINGRLRLDREVKDKEVQLEAAIKDRDRWEKIAFELLNLGERVTRIAEGNGRK